MINNKLILILVVGVAANWISDPTLKAQLKKTPAAVPKVTVNLDTDPLHRWDAITPQFKHLAPGVIAYLESIIPKWAVPIVEKIAADIGPYFPKDYGAEMIGLANGLGLKVGDVVAMNLIYQLESIGLNCSNWNNTGPTIPNDPGCMAVDPKQTWCYCHTHKDLVDKDGLLRKPKADGPGLCTSVVAADENGMVYHGRNLDWNLPDVVRQLAVDVEFVQNNKTVFIATSMVGFVGVVNGMRKSSSQSGYTYSVSIDARGKGGKIIDNLLEALLHHANTPSQHLRRTFETADTFEQARQQLSTGDLVDEIYYIAAGSNTDQGVVISRDRNDGSHARAKPADQWAINTTEPTGWYRLETNYDHWQPVPKADDRRTPGVAAMNKMGRAALNGEQLLGVMKVWPVFNHHTDYTGLFIPSMGHYQSIIWMGDD